MVQSVWQGQTYVGGGEGGANHQQQKKVENLQQKYKVTKTLRAIKFCLYKLTNVKETQISQKARAT